MGKGRQAVPIISAHGIDGHASLCPSYYYYLTQEGALMIVTATVDSRPSSVKAFLRAIHSHI